MDIWGDYHTHTTYSHGTGSVEDSVAQAVKIGLKEIAITDHGFSHLVYSVKRKEYPQLLKDVEECRKKYPSIKIYAGVEANLLNRKGEIDVLETDKPSLDIIVCGYHKLVKTGIGSYFNFFMPNWAYKFTKKATKKQIVRNTDCYLKAIENNEIDILSHMASAFPADCFEVAKACKHFGTYVELNGKGNFISDKDLEKMCEYGVSFITDSDAHSQDRIGEISKPLEIIDRLHIPSSLIANDGKLPQFRSRKLK